MKIEFIIDKIEYKKLLSKDIISSDIEYCNKKIKGKSNYLLIMSTQNKSIAAAKLLSKNRIAVEKIFADNNIKYRFLTEEASLFFCKGFIPMLANLKRNFVNSFILHCLILTIKQENL